MAVSFEKDVKPYFTATDQDHMSFMFDLWNASDVQANFDGILDALMTGRMPLGDPWPQPKRDQFKTTFEAWKAGGYQP